MRRLPQFSILCLLVVIAGCSEKPAPDASTIATGSPDGAALKQGDPVTDSHLAKATFGAGCFWCVEAVFQRVAGVTAVESGYTGGQTENPTYREICTGTTGHAEVAQITYDPAKVTFKELLEVFWQTHDPTTLNRQGADRGTQYRSAVFYHSDEQRDEATELKNRLDESQAFGAPIVTEISKLGRYYKAEEDHQNYFNDNRTAGYCLAVIAPKLEKFKAVFRDKLKRPSPSK